MCNIIHSYLAPNMKKKRGYYMIERNTVILDLDDYDKFRDIEQKYLRLRKIIIPIKKDEKFSVFEMPEIDHYLIDIKRVKEFFDIPSDKKIMVIEEEVTK